MLQPIRKRHLTLTPPKYVFWKQGVGKKASCFSETTVTILSLSLCLSLRPPLPCMEDMPSGKKPDPRKKGQKKVRQILLAENPGAVSPKRKRNPAIWAPGFLLMSSSQRLLGADEAAGGCHAVPFLSYTNTSAPRFFGAAQQSWYSGPNPAAKGSEPKKWCVCQLEELRGCRLSPHEQREQIKENGTRACLGPPTHLHPGQ